MERWNGWADNIDEEVKTEEQEQAEIEKALGKMKFAYRMNERELREAKTTRKNNKHKAREFWNLWELAYYFKDEYKSVLAEYDRGQFYTLYNIFNYIFVNMYSKYFEYDEWENESLRNIIETMGVWLEEEDNKEFMEEYCSDCEYYEGEIPCVVCRKCEHRMECVVINGSDEDTSEKYFKAFVVKNRRKLKKYFNVIFEKENSLEMLKKVTKNTFNVLDFGFICYLLSSNAESDLKHFIKGKYEVVNEDFYIKTYKGLCLMARFHNIGIDKEKINDMWRNKFKVKWMIEHKNDYENYIALKEYKR